MLSRIVFLCLLVSLPISSAFATQLSLVEGVITTQIVDRAPVDDISSYPAQEGKLFCFTRVAGAEGETAITHVWLYQDKEMARIELPVRSSSWRTYSSKKILPQWVGEWKVRVLDAAGEEVGVVPFTLL